MTLDSAGRATGPCPIGTCSPVDICERCRCIVTVDAGRAWHTDTTMQAAADHEAAPIVICAWCGTVAEAVGAIEMAEAWGEMLAARPCPYTVGKRVCVAGAIGHAGAHDWPAPGQSSEYSDAR